MPGIGKQIIKKGGTSGSGDVVWPASSTDNALARFNLATGKLIQDGIVTESDTGELNNVNWIQFDLTPTAVTPAEWLLHSINSLSEETPIWDIKSIVTDGTNKIQLYLWKIEEMEREKKILSESDELDNKVKEIQSKRIEKEIERINIELENMYSQEAELLQEQIIEKEILSINS